MLTPSRDELSLAITSADRAFTFAFTCTLRASSDTHIGGIVQVPRGWGFAVEAINATIDGVTRRLKVGGTDQGFVILSDAVQGESAFHSTETRRLLASGRELKVPGLTTDGRRMRTAVFNLPGNETAVAEFERRCRGGA